MKVLLIVQGPAQGDGVSCALANETAPEGPYPIDQLIEELSRDGAQIRLCGTCIDARGITEAQLTDSAHRSTMDELSDWTLWADKVVTF